MKVYRRLSWAHQGYRSPPDPANLRGPKKSLGDQSVGCLNNTIILLGWGGVGEGRVLGLGKGGWW